MVSLFSKSVLHFIEGMLGGIFVTVLWTRFARSKRSIIKLNGGEIKYDCTPSDAHGPNKLILLVRNDLKMKKGKVAAQCSHAAVLAHELCRKKYPDILNDWKHNGQPKIVVKVNSENEMLYFAEQAKKLQLLVSIVQDAGKTQVAPKTKTVLAIGPGPEDLINEVTGGHKYVSTALLPQNVEDVLFLSKMLNFRLRLGEALVGIFVYTSCGRIELINEAEEALIHVEFANIC